MATTRRYSFRSIHHLDVGARTEKVHGHQYFLEVSFERAEVSVVDRIVEEKILSRLDGHDASAVISPSTGENIVEWIHSELATTPLARNLIGVALQETRKNRFVSARSVPQII